MDKEDMEYLMLLVRERLRGWVELPPDQVIKEIIYDIRDELKVIEDKAKWKTKLQR